MLAMQYSIHLPHGFDRAKIEDRVRQRSRLFDDLDGMVHKAFLYNDADKLYAPFYVWADLKQARHFLMDELFRGVIQSFHRPRVRSWVMLDQAYGNRSIVPNFALREIDRIPAEDDLQALIRRERAIQDELLKDGNLYYHATAFDPDRWELMRYHLWKDQASAVHAAADCVQAYDVLHVSEPGQRVAA